MEEKKRQNTTTTDVEFSQVIARRFSLAVFIGIFRRTGLSPNQITTLNFLINSLLSVYFFSRGDYRGNLLGLFFCIFYASIDYIDGALARERKITSPFGEWLDSSLDFIWQIMLVMGITLGVFTTQKGKIVWLIFGSAAIIGLVVSNYVGNEYRRRFGLDFYKDAPSLRDIFAGRSLSGIERLYFNILAPATLPYICFFTIRYFVLLGAILNLMNIALVLIAIFSVIKSLVASRIFTLHFRFAEGESVPHRGLIELVDSYLKKCAANHRKEGS